MIQLESQCLPVVILLLVSGCLALPTISQDTTSSPQINSVVEDLRIQCSNNDGVACIKFKFLELLDHALKRDSFQLTDNVSVEKNSDVSTETSTENEKMNEASGRGFLDQVDEYISTHDVVFHLPEVLGGSRIALSPRSLDNDEVSLKLKMNDDSQVEGKARRNRLRKLLIPLVIFILLKAMTLVPLAIGILSLKAWNALQLSFFSFVISLSLAVFQLVKKVATTEAPIPAAHTGPWEAYSQYAAARNFLERAAGVADTTNDDPQAMAYSAQMP